MPGVRMAAALRRVVDSAVDAQKKGYAFVGSGCFFSAYLGRGERVQQSFDLEAGVQYAFLVGSDDREAPLRVAMFTEKRDAKGAPLSPRAFIEVTGTDFKDSRAGVKGKAILGFKPARTGRYTMTLVMDGKAAAPGAFCSMAVLQGGGGGVRAEAETLAAVCGTVLKRCADLAVRSGAASVAAGGARPAAGANAAAVAVDTAFHRGGGTWALYGWILGTGERIQSDPGLLGDGERLLMALSDDAAGDIDLNLLDGEGRILTGAEDPNDPRPEVRVRAEAGKKYALEVSRDASVNVDRPSLVVAAVLDLKGGDAEGTTPGAAASSSAPVRGAKFKGTWRDTRDGRDEQGQMDLTVGDDGVVSGTITSDYAGLRGPVTGRLDRATGDVDLTFHWETSPANDTVRVRGAIRLSEAGARLLGRLNMTATRTERTYAEAAVDLRRAD
jgi:hypothetical protein